MKTITRILAVLLVVLMLVPMIASCKKEEEEGAESTTVASTAGATPRSETPDSLPDNLDFGGEEIKIFWGAYDTSFNAKELECDGSLTSDSVSQAVYYRNESVEKRLNIDLVFMETDAVATTKAYTSAIESLVVSMADESVDVIYHRAANATSHVVQGYFRQLGDLQYLDFDQPWWFTEQMNRIAFKEGEPYILMGDLLVSNYANMSAMFFNKDYYSVLYQRDADELYDMVKNGEWTWDTYFKICSEAYIDNGNGIVDIEDKFGSHYESSSTRTAGYYAFTSGLSFSGRDAEGYPTIDINNSISIELVERLYGWIYETGNLIDFTFDEAKQSFYNGNVLFHTYFLTLGKFVQSSAEFDYGVIPFPKYSEDYDYQTAILTGAGVYCIPQYLGEDSLASVGATLEALCAESYRKVSYEYYDTVLKTKQAGSGKDAEMIDLMRDNLSFDILYWIGPSIGAPQNFFHELITKKQSKDFASYWGQKGGGYEGSLATVIETYV